MSEIGVENRKTGNSVIYGLILLCIAAVYTVVVWLYPFLWDDWRFMKYWTTLSPDYEFSFSNLFSYYDMVRAEDNGRISNLLSPFTTLFSPWKELFPIITGAFMAVIIGLVQKISCRSLSVNKVAFLCLSWIMLLVLLPWFNTIFNADYALNYIWGSAINLCFVYFLVRLEKNGWNPVSFVIFLLFTIVVGGWHEGFALATGFGIFCLMLDRKFRFSWQFYIVFVVLILSTICFYITPGMMARSSVLMQEVGIMMLIEKKLLSRLLFVSIPPVLLILTLLLPFVLKRQRAVYSSLRSNPFMVIAGGILVSGYLFAYILNPSARTFFWPIISCVVIMIGVFANLAGEWERFLKFRLFESILGYFFLALCLVQSVFTIIWLDRYNRQNNEILDQIIANPGSTVYYDILKPADLPVYTLKIPPQILWNDPVPYWSMGDYLDFDYIGIVPTGLKNVDLSQRMPLHGNRNAFRAGNYIFAPYRKNNLYPDRDFPMKAVVKVNDGQTENEMVVMEIPYITSPYRHADGEVRSDTLMYYDFSPNRASGISSLDLTGTVE